MRLTPIEFKKLRIIDCVNIIKSYFKNLDYSELEPIIKDRFITPAKLIWLCSTFNNIDQKTFITNTLTDAFQ